MINNAPQPLRQAKTCTFMCGRKLLMDSLYIRSERGFREEAKNNSKQQHVESGSCYNKQGKQYRSRISS